MDNESANETTTDSVNTTNSSSSPGRTVLKRGKAAWYAHVPKLPQNWAIRYSSIHTIIHTSTYIIYQYTKTASAKTTAHRASIARLHDMY